MITLLGALIISWLLCKLFLQSLRMCIVYRLRFLTRRIEVAAPKAAVERDALARSFILARLLARREGGAFARRPGQVDLALVQVAFLLVKVKGTIFQSLRMCIGSLRFLTPSGEVAAPKAVVERDALARWFILARLLALREGGAFARRPVQVDLALLHVAFLLVKAIIFQSLRMCIGRRRFLTPSVEVAAPPVTVERDAMTGWFILARLLALRDGGAFARRLAQPDLALLHVAFLLVKAIIFQSLRMCIGRRPFLTPSAEVAAPPVTVEREAMTGWFILARLRARRDGGAFARRPVQVDLALFHVALLAVEIFGEYRRG